MTRSIKGARRSAARSVTLVADNGGGITLQITDRLGRRWQHCYDGQPVQLADDLRKSQAADLYLPEWDGDDSADGWVEPTAEEQRNGGYRVYDAGEVCAMTDPDEAWGHAMGALVVALRWTAP